MREPPIVRPAPRTGHPPAPQTRRSQWHSLLDSRAAILLALFCVTGFLGIPLLWASGKFSRSEKIVWSCVVTVYTLVLLCGAAAICWWSYTRIAQLLT